MLTVVMPQRTNTFQQVVAVVASHMADGASVVESAMVTPIRGGEAREVDVLVTATVGGHEVSVGIEACRWSRKAGVGWVERMKAKHDDLPIDKVVLYSASGFTTSALDKAAEHGIAAIGAEEISDHEMQQCILGGLRSIWPNLVTLTPKRARLWVQRRDSEVVWFKAPADLALYLEDRTELEVDLRKAVLSKIDAQWEQVFDQIGLSKISETVERTFVIYWRPISISIEGAERRLFARNIDPPELHPIEQVEIMGDAVIEVQEVALNHMRLGETRVAYGEVALQGRAGVVVASDGPGNEVLTIRLTGAMVSTEQVQ